MATTKYVIVCLNDSTTQCQGVYSDYNEAVGRAYIAATAAADDLELNHGHFNVQFSPLRRLNGENTGVGFHLEYADESKTMHMWHWHILEVHLYHIT